MRIFKTSRSYKKEFKRQLRLAVTAGIGFTIAFAWRNAIFESMLNYVSRILDISPNHYLTEVYTAIFMTFLGVFLIFVTAKLLRDD